MIFNGKSFIEQKLYFPRPANIYATHKKVLTVFRDNGNVAKWGVSSVISIYYKEYVMYYNKGYLINRRKADGDRLTILIYYYYNIKLNLRRICYSIVESPT